MYQERLRRMLLLWLLAADCSNICSLNLTTTTHTSTELSDRGGVRWTCGPKAMSRNKNQGSRIVGVEVTHSTACFHQKRMFPSNIRWTKASHTWLGGGFLFFVWGDDRDHIGSSNRLIRRRNMKHRFCSDIEI